MITTLFDKPIFLCVIESTHLAIFYSDENRTVNIAYIERTLPISTIDDLMKHFEYDNFEERLFNLLASENKEGFESFLKLAQLSYDDNNSQRYVNFNYIIHINKNFTHKLSIRYRNDINDEGNVIINVALNTYNKDIGEFIIPVYTLTINDELDQQFEQSFHIAKYNMITGVKNILNKKLSDDYINKLWNHIKNAIPCYKTMNLTPDSRLFEEITDDISEGELKNEYKKRI